MHSVAVKISPSWAHSWAWLGNVQDRRAYHTEQACAGLLRLPSPTTPEHYSRGAYHGQRRQLRLLSFRSLQHCHKHHQDQLPIVTMTVIFCDKTLHACQSQALLCSSGYGFHCLPSPPMHCLHRAPLFLLCSAHKAWNQHARAFPGPCNSSPRQHHSGAAAALLLL